jgi:hypothetical protein
MAAILILGLRHVTLSDGLPIMEKNRPDLAVNLWEFSISAIERKVRNDQHQRTGAEPATDHRIVPAYYGWLQSAARCQFGLLLIGIKKAPSGLITSVPDAVSLWPDFHHYLDPHFHPLKGSAKRTVGRPPFRFGPSCCFATIHPSFLVTKKIR